jgi:DEAD/DEAH box helicase domain-containing protein
VPGGVGLAPRLFERHAELLSRALELVDACPCATGCPACTGPQLEPDADGKARGLRLLHLLIDTESSQAA